MATSLLSSIYESNPSKGKFSDIDFDFHGASLGATLSYIAAGLHKFGFPMDANPRNRHLMSTVTLQMKTIRGDAAFSEALDALDKKQGCYILYNSFTHEIYVGKSEGTNAESPGLKARFKTHRASPKLEFDMVFCVYLHDSVNDDLLKSCFTGQFLSFLEATLYSQVEQRVKVGYASPQDVIINQALAPIPPALYPHLHSLIADYVAPAFLDWAVLTGLTLHSSISRISRNSEAPDTFVNGLLPTSYSIPADTTGSTASPQCPIMASDSTTFKLTNTIIKKSPFNLSTSVFSGKSISDVFEEAIVHVLNEVRSGIGGASLDLVCQKLSSGSCGFFIQYISSTDSAPAWRSPRNISAKIHGLDSGRALYIDMHSNTAYKEKRINQLISHISEVTGQKFTLGDFIGA